MSRTRLVVLISGSGTLLQALLDAAADPHYPAEVVAVLSDSADAAGLQRARAAGLEGLVAEEGEQSTQVQTLERELVETQQALQEAKTGFGTLGDYVRCISEVLGQPEAHVQITPRTLFLNRMNFKLENGEADGAREIRLTEVALGDEIKRIVVLARFPRALILEKGHFLREAERYYS